MRGSSRGARDAGQALFVVLAVAVVLAAAVGGIARFGLRVVLREQAQVAADAAALAALTGGRAAADRVAAANGGAVTRLDLLDEDGQQFTATVVVRVRGVDATARASRAP